MVKAEAAWYTEDRPCPVCGASDAVELGVRGGRAHRSGKGIEANLVRCRGCHLVYQRPTLLPRFNAYDEHADEYFAHHDEHRVDIGIRLAREAEQVIGRRGRMLEIGCGRGHLLKGAAQAGWHISGIEMTESFARFAREHNGVEVDNAPVETSTLLDHKYDAILLAAVLEHLYEPAQVMARVYEALAPGGAVFIDVPNECSLLTRVGNAYYRARGRDWVTNLSPTFPPFHVVGFCPRSLRYLLAQAGLRVVDFQLHRWNNQLPKPRGARQWLEFRAFDAALSVGKWVGMGAGITCWAVRD